SPTSRRRSTRKRSTTASRGRSIAVACCGRCSRTTGRRRPKAVPKSSPISRPRSRAIGGRAHVDVHAETRHQYSPPLQDVTVTAQDFIRAMEREACGTCSTGGYSFYYSTIEGFDDFAAGGADTISAPAAADE